MHLSDSVAAGVASCLIPFSRSCGTLHLTAEACAQIVELLNAVYCLAELTEFAAFIWLRIKAPDLYRPYRVPLPTWACALMLLPASALLITILALPILALNWQVSTLEPARPDCHAC